jgi:predicted metal-dependent hydrolase
MIRVQVPDKNMVVEFPKGTSSNDIVKAINKKLAAISKKNENQAKKPVKSDKKDDTTKLLVAIAKLLAEKREPPIINMPAPKIEIPAQVTEAPVVNIMPAKKWTVTVSDRDENGRIKTLDLERVA